MLGTGDKRETEADAERTVRSDRTPEVESNDGEEKREESWREPVTERATAEKRKKRNSNMNQSPVHNNDNRGQTAYYGPVYTTDSRRQSVHHAPVYEKDNRAQSIYRAPVYKTNNSGQFVYDAPVYETDNSAQTKYSAPVHRTGQTIYHGDVYVNDNSDQKIYRGEVRYNGGQKIHHVSVSDDYSESVFNINASPMADIFDRTTRNPHPEPYGERDGLRKSL